MPSIILDFEFTLEIGDSFFGWEREIGGVSECAVSLHTLFGRCILVCQAQEKYKNDGHSTKQDATVGAGEGDVMDASYHGGELIDGAFLVSGVCDDGCDDGSIFNDGGGGAAGAATSMGWAATGIGENGEGEGIRTQRERSVYDKIIQTREMTSVTSHHHLLVYDVLPSPPSPSSLCWTNAAFPSSK